MHGIQILNPTGNPVLFEATSSKVLPAIPAGTDGLVFTGPTKLFIGTGGILKCKLWGDDIFQSFKNLPDGQPFFGILKAIHADSTVTDVIIIG